MANSYSRSSLKSVKSTSSSSSRRRTIPRGFRFTEEGHSITSPINSLTTTRSSGRYRSQKRRRPPLVINNSITSRDKRDYARELHESFTSEQGLSFEEINCDEVDDMLPKTDYTYAKTESYSPKYSRGRYISPNMSRRRLRSSQPVFLSDDEEEFSQYENDHIVFSNNRVYSHSQTTESEVDSSTVGSGKFGITRVQNVMTSTPVIPHSLHQISTNDHYSNGILLRSGSHLKGTQRYSRDYTSSRSDSHSLHSEESVHANAVSNSAYRSDVDAALQHQSGGRNTIVTETTTTTTTTSSLHPSARKDHKQMNAFTGEDHSETKLRLDESQTEKKRNKQEYKLKHLYGLDYEEEFSDVDDMPGWDVTAAKKNYHSQRESLFFSYIATVITTIITTVTSTFSDGSTSFIKPLSVAASKMVAAPGRWLGMSTMAWAGSWLESTAGWAGSLLESTTAWAGSLLESTGAWARWLITRSVTLLLWDIDVKQRRRRECCYCLLPLLFLLPLLLLGGYYTRALQQSVGAYLSDTWSWSNVWFTHSSSYHAPFSANSPPASTPTSTPFQASNTEAAHQMNMTQIYEFMQQMSAASAASGQKNTHPGLTREQVEAIVQSLLASNVHEITILQGQVEAMKILLQGDITSLQQKVTGLEAEIRTVVGSHQVLTDKLNQASGSFQGFAGQNVDWLAASRTWEHKLLNLTEEVNNLSSQYAFLNTRLANCCRNSSEFDGIVRAHVYSLLSQMSTDKDSPLSGLVVQMGQHYVDKAELDQRLSAMTLEVIKSVKSTLAEAELKSNANVQEPLIANLNETAVKLIIEEALNQFSADRVGMADFALESAGGSVISVRCSETYYKKTALVSVFGIPLWYTSNSPRTVIQPNVHPGECWAFKGQTGYMVFQLSLPIEPSGFTLEHIPRSLTPTGDISSAPKDFAVFGLLSEKDTEGVKLGNYTYEDNGIPIQFFPVQNTKKVIFQLIELRILGNHGNINYTCVYRFRVHGKP